MVRHDAAKPEQVMSPSGPATAMASPLLPGPGGFSSREAGLRAQDSLGADTEEGEDAFRPNGLTGVIASSAAGGAAEDVSQTSNQRLSNRLQTQGGLQLEELAQTMQHRLPDPEGVVAAEAEVQAVVISEPGRFEAAENPRAGANVAGAAATAVRSGNAEAGGGFVTPQNSRSMRSAVELGEASGALPVGLRWLGRIGDFFRTGSGEGLPVQMWPSPFPSPERPAVDRGGAEGPLFGPDATWQLQVRIELHCCLVPPKDPNRAIPHLAAPACQQKPYKQKCSASLDRYLEQQNLQLQQAAAASERRLLPQPKPAAASAASQMLPQPRQAAAAEGRLLPDARSVGPGAALRWVLLLV